MRITADQVPIDARRRAARFLEALLESAGSPTPGGPAGGGPAGGGPAGGRPGGGRPAGGGPGRHLPVEAADPDHPIGPIGPGRPGLPLKRPTLGDEVAPVFRPDLPDVAYWEFEVVGVRTTLTGDGGRPVPFDRGFVLVATGGHDVPVPHFSLQGAPPSRRLEQLGGPATRVVKVDALCYVAEDEQGGMIAHVGTVPPKIEGAPTGGPLGAAVAPPSGDDQHDDPLDEGTAETPPLEVTKDERPVSVSPWSSWDELRAGYAASYAPHLAALADRARYPWDIEALTDKFGQGIREGEHLVVPLLERGEHAISGPGAQFVSAVLVDSVDPPRLVLTAGPSGGARDTSFVLDLRYRDSSESLSYFVVPAGAPTEVVPTPSPLGPTFGGAGR